ncbi:hypothetical protein [Nakamurella aerolata]|uniref:Uncharacterized protein n=1 Tax=Nakamurella aerolata TaxID=1656892 RepID=A0A849A9Q1_9ACTN|nr:hypothetical protein [Nakamurella aerolata]NNG35828.1 hypothetical protein [Nakamurella aerolata]
MKRYLVAYNPAAAGLGNRMRVVLGAKVLAEHEDRRLLYVWPTGPKFGPKLTELWDFTGGRRLSKYLSRALAPLVPYGDRDVRNSAGPDAGPRIRQIMTGGELQLPPGLRSWRDEFRSLRPAPPIAERVNAFHADQLGSEPYVGVQIRAHAVSHEKTKAMSPTSWFVDRMHQIEDADPGVRFFVSCDVPEVFEQITAEFPTAVGIKDKGAYNSTEGVTGGVADLYLLAGSGYLLGPYWSSFIELAQHLAGDRITVETANETATGGVDFTSLGVVADPLRPADRGGSTADRPDAGA